MKYCPCCKETLSKGDFYVSKGRLAAYCKTCWKQKVTAKYVKPNKEQSKAYVLKYKFNLTLEEYHKMYADQNGSCAICGKSVTLYAETKDLSSVACVDHCHTTNVVRGLLCNKCNTGIGMLEDNINTLKNAIKYLEKGIK